MIKKECRLTRAAMCFQGGGMPSGGGADPYTAQHGYGIGQLFGGASQYGIGNIANQALTQNATGGAMQGYSGFTPTGSADVGGTPPNTGGTTTGGGTGSGGPLNTNFPNAGGYHGASMFRTPSSEAPILQNWFNRQIGDYGDFRSSDALLGPATQGALGFWNQLPGMLGQFKGFGNELSGYQSNFDKFLGPNSALSKAYGGPGGIGETLASHGALTPDQLNARIQQGRVTGEQSGSLHDPSAYITDYTSRKDAEQANFNQALQQSQSALQQQSGAAGVGAGLTGQKAGLLGQMQALQTGGLNQLLGVGNAAVSQYTGLTQPVWNFLSNLFAGNQQAAVSAAQIKAQMDAASSGKKSGAVSGAGSVIGAALPVIASL